MPERPHKKYEVSQDILDARRKLQAELAGIVSDKTLLPKARVRSAAATLTAAINAGVVSTWAPLLPFLFKIGRKPFSLKNHYMWEALFPTRPPTETTVKCGRQVGKSEMGANKQIMFTLMAEPASFNTLYVAPRYAQMKTVSVMKINRFFKDSPYLHNKKGEPFNISQKTLVNGNSMFFSYALLDAERIRSITANAVFIDEAQDILLEVLPVIFEVSSATNERLKIFTGTPKTFDNTLEVQWERSSQAEWVVKCPACGLDNIPSANHHLLKMIADNGLVCAKCGRTLDSRFGRWVHAYPERRDYHEGFHAPQIIFPHHFRYDPNNPKHDHDAKINSNWFEILRARDSGDTRSFYNEKLGESYDDAEEMVSRKALIECSDLDFSLEKARSLQYVKSKEYRNVYLGVDWGGAGIDGTSRTALALIVPDGNRMAVPYMERLVNVASPTDEAQYIASMFREFRCTRLAHDYCGAGYVREETLMDCGVPPDLLAPMYYVGAATRDVISYVPPSETNLRPYLSLHKARSLQLMTTLINAGYYRFPKFDSWNNPAKSYGDEFLALVQEQRPRASGESFVVIKKKGRADDLAMALNYASWAAWYAVQQYPSPVNYKKYSRSIGGSG